MYFQVLKSKSPAYGDVRDAQFSLEAYRLKAAFLTAAVLAWFLGV